MNTTEHERLFLVQPQPTHCLIPGIGGLTFGMDQSKDGALWYDGDCINPGREVTCPHGQIGDIVDGNQITDIKAAKFLDGYWYWVIEETKQ